MFRVAVVGRAKAVLCTTGKGAAHFRIGSCVTSIAGPHGGAQLYER